MKKHNYENFVEMQKQKSLQSYYYKFSREMKELAGWRCSICRVYNPENKIKNIEPIVCHHINPIVYHGIVSYQLTNPENIQVVCSHCHWTVCHGKSKSLRIWDLFASRGRFQKLNQNISLNFKNKLLQKYGK